MKNIELLETLRLLNKNDIVLEVKHKFDHELDKFVERLSLFRIKQVNKNTFSVENIMGCCDAKEGRINKEKRVGSLVDGEYYLINSLNNFSEAERGQKILHLKKTSRRYRKEEELSERYNIFSILEETEKYFEVEYLEFGNLGGKKTRFYKSFDLNTLKYENFYILPDGSYQSL